MDQRPLPGGGRLFVARGAIQRLLGLAGLKHMPADCGLLIDRCASVHTAWMRFAIDVVFIDADGRPLRAVAGLRPWRVAWCRGARAVIEGPAGLEGVSGSTGAAGYWTGMAPLGRDGLTRKPGRLPLVKTPLPALTFHGLGATWRGAERKRVNNEEI